MNDRNATEATLQEACPRICYREFEDGVVCGFPEDDDAHACRGTHPPHFGCHPFKPKPKDHQSVEPSQEATLRDLPRRLEDLANLIKRHDLTLLPHEIIEPLLEAADALDAKDATIAELAAQISAARADGCICPIDISKPFEPTCPLHGGEWK